MQIAVCPIPRNGFGLLFVGAKFAIKILDLADRHCFRIAPFKHLFAGFQVIAANGIEFRFNRFDQFRRSYL